MASLVKEDGVRASARVRSNVANVYLSHGGLEFLDDKELLSSWAFINRAFRNAVHKEFERRKQQQHSGIWTAIQSKGCYSWTWKDWVRYERKPVGYGLNGDMLTDVANESDLCNDFDVLVEISQGGRPACHGIQALCYESTRLFPGCKVIVAPWTIQAPLADERKDVFTEGAPDGEGSNYRYWYGHEDCSLQQKTICKALYGVEGSKTNIKSLPANLHVHVVLRRRSTGAMVTVLSSHTPTQIIGEDYGYDVGHYLVKYATHLSPKDKQGRTVYGELRFSLFCEGKLDSKTGLNSILQFNSVPLNEESSRLEPSKLGFVLGVSKQYPGKVATEQIIRVLRSLPWDCEPENAPLPCKVLANIRGDLEKKSWSREDLLMLQTALLALQHEVATRLSVHG